MHPSWQSEFQRRWQQVSPLLLGAFVLTQLVLVTLLAIGNALVTLDLADGVIARFSIPVVALPAGYLIWFYVSKRFLARNQRWLFRVLGAGGIQVWGIILASAFSGPVLTVLLPVLTVVTTAAGGMMVHRAHHILFEPSGGALGATDIPMRHDLRVHFPRMIGEVTLDRDRLRWELRPWGTYLLPIKLVSDELPLAHITHVSVQQVMQGQEPFLAHNIPVPPGPVVVVRTPYREVVLALDTAMEFAGMLDLRLRLLASGAAQAPYGR